MTFNFTGTGGVLTASVNTETGKYPTETYTYNGASSALVGSSIYISDYGVTQRSYKFHEIGTIAGATPTDIADAQTKILAIILTAPDCE